MDVQLTLGAEKILLRLVTSTSRPVSSLPAEVRGDQISGGTHMAKLADLWVAELQRETALSDRSPSTVRLYRGHLRNWVLPAVGELQARELTVAACDRLVKKVQDATSYDNAKSVRAVLTRLCGYAVRHGAMPVNPARSIGRLARGDQKEIQALDLAQRGDLLAKLEAFAREKQADSMGRSLGARARVWVDLPDIVRTMLATGCGSVSY